MTVDIMRLEGSQRLVVKSRGNSRDASASSRHVTGITPVECSDQRRTLVTGMNEEVTSFSIVFGAVTRSVDTAQQSAP